MDPSVETILRSARRLSGRDPAWTMASLAEEAGVSPVTLYRRFASRSAVADALAADGDAPPDQQSRALDARGRVVERLEPSRFTMEDVASETGYGVATLYRTFGTREDLVTAFAEARTPIASLGELRLDRFAPLADALEAVVVQALAHAQSQRAWLPLALLPGPNDAPARHLRVGDAVRWFEAIGV